jgi:hypothetical protein
MLTLCQDSLITMRIHKSTTDSHLSKGMVNPNYVRDIWPVPAPNTFVLGVQTDSGSRVDNLSE